ncbi:hypothetical protein KY492_08260 [Brevibacterium sp. PAMC21349]|nr:hypothetical protein KY492_08260 [Brevibacterium sp. PAMC21349]
MSTIQINHDDRIKKDFLGSKQVPVHAYYVSQHCVQSKTFRLQVTLTR